MAYSVNLFITDSDSNVVNKSLNLLETKSCVIRSTEDIVNPSIMVNLSEGTNINYARIDGAPFDGRYYFVEPYTASSHGIVVLNLHEDVLMSLKSQFLEQTAIISRQENEGNLYITDGNFPVENRNNIYFKQFPNGFDTGLKYYITVGG